MRIKYLSTQSKQSELLSLTIKRLYGYLILSIIFIEGLPSVCQTYIEELKVQSNNKNLAISCHWVHKFQPGHIQRLGRGQIKSSMIKSPPRQAISCFSESKNNATTQKEPLLYSLSALYTLHPSENKDTLKLSSKNQLSARATATNQCCMHFIGLCFLWPLKFL